jgi:hypothetical protein
MLGCSQLPKRCSGLFDFNCIILMDARCGVQHVNSVRRFGQE